MFDPGDVVLIKKEYLDEHEDPDTKYYVVEDNGDGRVKVIVPANLFTGYATYVWADYMFTKIGHIDLDKLLK